MDTDWISKKLEENKKISNEDIVRAILDVNRNLSKAVEDNKQIIVALNAQVELQNKKIEALEKSNSVLEKKLMSADCERVKNNIILKDIPNQAKNKDQPETYEETRKVIDQVLVSIEAKADIQEGYEARRILPPKNSKSDKPPPIAIHFWTAECKRIFFRQLAKKKPKTRNDLVKKVKVSDEIPKCLQEDYKRLNKEAYEFRKSNPGAKTAIRMVAKDARVILLAKKATDTQFQSI